MSRSCLGRSYIRRNLRGTIFLSAISCRSFQAAATLRRQGFCYSKLMLKGYLQSAMDLLRRGNKKQSFFARVVSITIIDRQMDSRNSIITKKRKKYSFFQRFFCCKCLDCLKDDINITSEVRKQTLQRMIRNFVIEDHQDTLYDPIKLMILIHLCEDPSIPHRFLARCRINPLLKATYRDDLLFFIPQLCNYLVYHDDLKPGSLADAVQRCCKLSPYFAHTYYFYMLSLERSVQAHEIEILASVKAHVLQFIQEMNTFYSESLCAPQYYLGLKLKSNSLHHDLSYMLKGYGASTQHLLFSRPVEVNDITLPNYVSIFGPEEAKVQPFSSTLEFFSDLFAIVQEVQDEASRQRLKQLLQKVNSRLPASVYVPFSKNGVNLCNVLNIVSSEARIFSTKQRAPVYLCIEIYNPIEAFSEQEETRFWKAVNSPVTLKKKNEKSSQHIFSSPPDSHIHTASVRQHTEVFMEREGSFLGQKLLEMNNEMQTQPRLGKDPVELKDLSKPELLKKVEGIFGESEEDMSDRIKFDSVFGGFHTWRLLHIILKTNDNLKQEQFALQLISQFDTIFRLEQLSLLLTPYEVLTMGSDQGIIEMVRETVTFDRLKRHLKTNFTPPLALRDFFEVYYGAELSPAKDTFMQSLAGYSLVMYFLQAKDRHNGNILLHRSGKILHIDFGFFLSNMPGKGVELERDCPFKLLSQHLEVLDGPESSYFKRFRQLFFQGFKAARKHQNKILMLVKMMYSSSGASMPCFEKGEQAITALQNRFNPPDVHTDAQLNLHCQKLINSSLDNWATKWYDRFQYFAQGIFY